MLRSITACLLALMLSFQLTACARFARMFGPDKQLELAEQFLRQSRYDDAISAYRKHIDERLALEDRPEWENPWFYLLMIGDVELRAGQPEKAILSYTEAETRGVDTSLVLDRYRSTAAWYEKEGRLAEAANLLATQRDRDPLIFNGMLDRISREIVAQEDSPAAPLPTPAS